MPDCEHKAWIVLWGPFPTFEDKTKGWITTVCYGCKKLERTLLVIGYPWSRRKVRAVLDALLPGITIDY